MAKEQAPAASVADRVEVKHLATPDGGSDAVCDVLLSGKRVAYVFCNKDLTVSFLPHEHTKCKLTAAQYREIEAVAKAKAKDFAESEAAERAELKALGVIV